MTLVKQKNKKIDLISLTVLDKQMKPGIAHLVCPTNHSSLSFSNNLGSKFIDRRKRMTYLR
jgi:hypothetical protein